ncbi:hypothetical protein J6590_033801 [Homalodisca vitripennis]|nr:hypothetical protein J6590_033801 [Homalodisca vitripennis]
MEVRVGGWTGMPPYLAYKTITYHLALPRTRYQYHLLILSQHGTLILLQHVNRQAEQDDIDKTSITQVAMAVTDTYLSQHNVIVTHSRMYGLQVTKSYTRPTHRP